MTKNTASEIIPRTSLFCHKSVTKKKVSQHYHLPFELIEAASGRKLEPSESILESVLERSGVNLSVLPNLLAVAGFLPILEFSDENSMNGIQL
jgi:hypothetical protein